MVLRLSVHMQPQCLVHSSRLSGREAERGCCATGVQKRNVCLPCHGVPLMAFFLPLVIQVGIASLPVFLNMLHFLHRHLTLSFFPVLWKGNGGRSGTSRAMPSSTLGVGFPSICLPLLLAREIPSCPRFCAEVFNALMLSPFCVSNMPRNVARPLFNSEAAPLKRNMAPLDMRMEWAGPFIALQEKMKFHPWTFQYYWNDFFSF